jgi:hypothetical protein
MTFRRVSGLLIAAILIGIPLLQLRCAVSCADDRTQTTTSTCRQHHADVTAPVLESDQCCRDSATPALVAAVAHRELSGSPAILVASFVAPDLVAATNTASTVPLAPPGGPPGSYLVPLRV